MAAKARKRGGRQAATLRHRLEPSIRPIHVRLHVELDPERGDRFRGRVAIELDVARSTRRIELNAVDLRVSRPRVVDAAGQRLSAKLAPARDKERIAVALETPAPRGTVHLELDFAGRLRKDLCGLYGVEVDGRRYAFTQLEPADARKFFPCFDEPSMKARWEISVTTADAHAVISNAPVARRERTKDGRTTTHFAPTPPLSSYLVALAVGPLERSRARKVGATEIRTWHVPGKASLCRFGLEAAAETLALLERYFALPYPYAKLDLVAVPDFEFGAMENAGAVFFRETLLLLDDATATLAEKKRAAEVICHELAHMWYGDLVTMEWWDDLWLNEAFATWMAFHIVDQWKPEWRMWHDFQHHRAAALDLDSLKNTHPIYTEVRTPEEANENFDLITYEKGASVVRMLERYLGASTFRKGVRTYIRRHAESNAVASDLWNALAEAAKAPVEPIVRAWIEQDGFPIVRISRPARGNGREVVVSQERFQLAAPSRRKPGTKRESWPVPWVGRPVGSRGRSKPVRHLLRKRSERVRAPQGALYGNADEGGFFRPLHEGPVHDALLASIKRLSPVERMGLVDHQWALAHAGHAPLASLLEVVERLAGDPSADVLSALQRPVASLTHGLAASVGDSTLAAQKAWVTQHFGPLWRELGWRPKRGESVEEGLRRACALAIVGGVAESEDVVDEAVDRCRAYLEDRRAVDPNLADPLVSVAALRGGPALHRRFERAMRNAATPQEQRRFLLALCDFPEPQLIDQTLALCLGDAVATQDVAFVVARCLANPSGRERTWRVTQRRWKQLRKRIAPLLIPRIVSATPALGTAEARKEVAAFFRENPVPSGERTLKQALERFDAELRFRRRAKGELVTYLAVDPRA